MIGEIGTGGVLFPIRYSLSPCRIWVVEMVGVAIIWTFEEWAEVLNYVDEATSHLIC